MTPPLPLKRPSNRCAPRSHKILKDIRLPFRLCVLTVFPFAASAREMVVPADNVPRVALPLMRTAPTCDGVINEREWQDAARIVGFAAHRGGTITPRNGVFWLGCDGKQLFIAVRSQTPPDNSVLTRAVPHPKNDVKAAFLDDSLELVLDPKRGREDGERAFYHLISNARGALYDHANDPDDSRNPADFSWRLPKWSFRSGVSDGWWHVEMAFPLESLGANERDLATPWGIRVARNWRRPGAQSQWSGGGVSYLDQPSMPVVRWLPAAPITRVLDMTGDEDGRNAIIRVEVRNPHPKPIKARVVLSDAWHRNPATTIDQIHDIPAGGAEVVEMISGDAGDAGLHHTVLRVTSPLDDTVYFARDVRWTFHRPDAVWSIGKEQKRSVNLLFKYYPYHNKIRLRVDLTALASRTQVTGGTAGIFRAPRNDASPPIWETKLAFADHMVEDIHAIPDLPDGDYEVSVLLAGDKTVPSTPVVQPFVRKRFEWEGNQLGITDEVMPPFEPLTVEGANVACVLRTHQHGSTGLWDSVETRGQQLLSGPMRWEVTTHTGKQTPASQSVAGRGWAVVSRRANQVAGKSSWRAGAISARVETEYDVDGMMLTTLTLPPTERATLDRLSLAIPIRNALARYMHAVGDSLRHNYAGFVPEGDGPIWDSSKGNKIDIQNTFFPYLWVGGAERGVCWFADTDRGWALDAETPTIELIRQGDTLTMRVNLVTKPTRLTSERRIVFGLQVTPTKPMPEGWRRWTGNKSVPGGRSVGWLGSCYYWGGVNHDLYPYKKTFEFYDELKKSRETGTINEDFKKRWMALIETRHPNDGKGYSAHGYEFMRLHMNAGFHRAKSCQWKDGSRLFGYTNARGIGFQAPEFATFQDEWLRYGWFNRDWSDRSGVGYDVSPSRSFVDCAVWYYRKMLTWTDGVYWDNMFLSAHYDPVVGNAWIDDAGAVHPGMGLFHLRELVKRTAIMHWQEGKKLPASRLPLIQLSHMTNTMIVPILSYGNCNMDWEWRYGYSDFQDRFSPDLAVAETIGRQVGAWPTILAGGHPKVDDPRTPRMWRTRLGVCLVHEIQNFDYRPKSDYELYRKLFEFGYGGPDCAVYNYWDTPQPIRIDGVDARTLTISKPGATVVVVTDYGDGGKAQVTLDRKALKLGVTPEASDFETGEPVEMTAARTCTFELDKHALKILLVR
ncbi:MAG: hypothetical protein HN742_07520 [Lentisphaerae bacterium]|nr:hypothetical protein [Lentisphaerota bacterium]MBT5609396.1 hypothetical protein [Lentisphaerota bacterium]MBT7060227.1 hypothetical protein [Lentisphaerota bacterium]MBT7841704.1 hypothetical protein [Lentisphaerota bacterium]